MDSHFNYFYVRTFVFIVTVCVYCYLFYGIFSCEYLSDFTSFYASSVAARHGNNPYLSLVVKYSQLVRHTTININPPIIYILFYPLTFCSYTAALWIWMTTSLVMTLFGGWFAFRVAFSKDYLKKYWLGLFLVYLLLFHNLLDIFLNQLGGLIMLFISLGYYYYLKKSDYIAGLLWGFIIALKLFPGLLFFFVLKENRKTVLATMLLTILCCFLLPLFVYGSKIYTQFFQVLTGVYWYHFSWNASLLGFLHAIFFWLDEVNWIAPTYIVLSLIYLIVYLWLIRPSKDDDVVNHQAFCLTLLLMIILSPLGWSYYFPLLLIPVALLWASCMNEQEPLSISATIWLCSLFCLNYPLSRYADNKPMEYHGISTMIPINFIGLAILFGLVAVSKPKLKSYSHVHFDDSKNKFVLFTALIIAFTFSVRSIGISIFLTKICGL
ncbi:glycosyltransferase family 87 protein [Legionella waltersii]|uniref:DUF2029 domain-containing protein n=1 Tax=Legionella waltersii TaxID=66969 RepID=A0A0W1AMJ9_9GAMM|nr:glycosyltransferase family 87 protein [Legionella waltersii]KTD82570.1 hypothetical protein Lwal_0499 [Legionella waltersii]SNV02462.1 Protein of uncharacterised function (DUF2029) [Legionella waltersii]